MYAMLPNRTFHVAEVSVKKKTEGRLEFPYSKHDGKIIKHFTKLTSFVEHSVMDRQRLIAVFLLSLRILLLLDKMEKLLIKQSKLDTTCNVSIGDDTKICLWTHGSVYMEISCGNCITDQRI